MVQRIVHYRNCDWEPEGTDVRVRDERVPIRFAVGSTQYVVDECEKHAGQAMKILTQVTAIASREDGKAQGGSRRAPRTAAFRAQTSEVRSWAQQNFPERHVSDRGRIPLDLQKAYDKAH
jgi:hypothetical protein